MQFLYLSNLRPGILENDRPENLEELIKKEIEHAKRGYMDGILRQIWYQVPGPGAVALIETDTVESAKGIVDAFPLARFLEYRLIELAPYSGFAEG